MFQFDCSIVLTFLVILIMQVDISDSNCGLPFGQSFGPRDEGYNSMMDCLKQSQVETMEQRFKLVTDGEK